MAKCLGKIEIKSENKGKFSEHCGVKVTDKCIEKGLCSPNETTRKRAQFAKNAKSLNK